MGKTISDELLSSLVPLSEQGLIEVIEDGVLFFELIEQYFPTSGTKVDWTKAIDVTEEKASGRAYVEDSIAFLRRLMACHKIEATEEVVVVGDAAMDFAVATIAETLEVVLVEVLYMPQHTYVIPLTGEWCLAFTMERDMTFGRSPRWISEA